MQVLCGVEGGSVRFYTLAISGQTESESNDVIDMHSYYWFALVAFDFWNVVPVMLGDHSICHEYSSSNYHHNMVW